MIDISYKERMKETENAKDFFEKNEEEVCKTICRILFGMTLVFPALFLCSAVHIFQIEFRELIPISIFGVICTVSPILLWKCRVPIRFIKNYSIIALAVVIALMAANADLGIYMTYVLALSLSCLYFDKKFTIRTAIIGFICMIIAVYFRSGNVTLQDGDTRMKWFIGYGMGYTIEYIAMSAVFFTLTKRARKLLENLHSAENVKEILDNCGTASTGLSNLLRNLKEAIRNTVDNNQKICYETDLTRTGCENNLELVRQTGSSINEMDENMRIISQQTEKMFEISTDAYSKIANYIEIMNEAVASMHRIEVSSESIREKIRQVGNCAKEIDSFADTIAGIANQTNILAINASIEAVRAGEQGRGFSVVASRVGELAEECKIATQSITAQIQEMNTNVKDAHTSVDENSGAVLEGIKKIDTAKEEAGKLLDIQNASMQKVKEVEENLERGLNHQKQVAAMAEDMNGTTSKSLEQVKVIHQAIGQQAEMTTVIQETFEEVQKISDSLLAISMQETADI